MTTISAPSGSWVSCDNCGDFRCNHHNQHVYECDCPPIDEWVEQGKDPYLSEEAQKEDAGSENEAPPLCC